MAWRGVTLFLLLTPVELFAADMHLRFARLTLAEGRVEVEHAVTGERMPAERNLPVGQGFWVETAVGAQAELEVDEGSYVRLGPASLAELSDLTRLSTGQRVTLVSLERGILYATSEPSRLDAFVIVAPGLEITFLAGSRVRVEAGDETSTVAVLEGRVRFSSRPAELELRAGHTVHVNAQHEDRFQLLREVTATELDRWNEQRDREAAERAAGPKLPVFLFGLGELDAQGKWIDQGDLGKVWQPRAPEGWAPYRLGHWRWYDGLGYTWVSGEPWGWLPYHYGRWTYTASSGWLWVPAAKEDPEAPFHRGETYWLRAAGFIGWGPLAPGEEWRPDVRPSLYSTANTTFAAYRAGDRVIDPAPALRLAEDPLKSGQFLASLAPPPPWPGLAAHRKRTRVGTTRILLVTADQSYDSERANAPSPLQEKIRVVGGEPTSLPVPVEQPAPAQPPLTYYNYPVVAPAPLPPPLPPSYYPVYVPEIVVVERERRSPGGHGGGQSHGGNAPGRPEVRPPSTPPASAAPPLPAAPPPKPPAPAAQPPAPKPEAPPSSEGPEHRSRLRSPESGEAQSRRR